MSSILVPLTIRLCLIPSLIASTLISLDKVHALETQCYDVSRDHADTCSLSAKPYALNGRIGTMILVTITDTSIAKRHPEVPSLGVTTWRYWTITDCNETSKPIPVKVGFMDMPDLSDGWLYCPIHEGSIDSRIIYNSSYEPLFRIPYVFID